MKLIHVFSKLFPLITATFVTKFVDWPYWEFHIEHVWLLKYPIENMDLILLSVMGCMTGSY